VAIDSLPPVPAVDRGHDSAIDNEVLAYRALSPLAIVSVIFGCASIFTFTHPGFAVLGVLAVGLGLLALRQIRKRPNVLTGTKLANTGIGTALFFTLMAATISGVQGWIYQHEAGKFARAYVDAIKKGGLNDLIYFQIAPSSRGTKTPQQLVDEIRAMSRHSDEFTSINHGLINLIRRTNAAGPPTVEFVRIEGSALEGIMRYASATRPGQFPGEHAIAGLSMDGSRCQVPL